MQTDSYIQSDELIRLIYIRYLDTPSVMLQCLWLYQPFGGDDTWPRAHSIIVCSHYITIHEDLHTAVYFIHPGRMCDGCETHTYQRYILLVNTGHNMPGRRNRDTWPAGHVLRTVFALNEWQFGSTTICCSSTKYTNPYLLYLYVLFNPVKYWAKRNWRKTIHSYSNYDTSNYYLIVHSRHISHARFYSAYEQMKSILIIP